MGSDSKIPAIKYSLISAVKNFHFTMSVGDRDIFLVSNNQL